MRLQIYSRIAPGFSHIQSSTSEKTRRVRAGLREADALALLEKVKGEVPGTHFAFIDPARGQHAAEDVLQRKESRV